MPILIKSLSSLREEVLGEKLADDNNSHQVMAIAKMALWAM